MITSLVATESHTDGTILNRSLTVQLRPLHARFYMAVSSALEIIVASLRNQALATNCDV